jgi:hypothetical protein
MFRTILRRDGRCEAHGLLEGSVVQTSLCRHGPQRSALLDVLRRLDEVCGLCVRPLFRC